MAVPLKERAEQAEKLLPRVAVRDLLVGRAGLGVFLVLLGGCLALEEHAEAHGEALVYRLLDHGEGAKPAVRAGVDDVDGRVQVLCDVLELPGPPAREQPVEALVPVVVAVVLLEVVGPVDKGPVVDVKEEGVFLLLTLHAHAVCRPAAAQEELARGVHVEAHLHQALHGIDLKFQRGEQFEGVCVLRIDVAAVEQHQVAARVHQLVVSLNLLLHGRVDFEP
mmetsp:Transcript_22589/g.43866  ORF Transcript_22589/g.43866 Transcript_22589/m.43866 type:complete len:222 (+) Transcript_22589:358-1023(+)